MNGVVHSFDKQTRVYKGKSFSKKKIKNSPRVVAFDLDETLGSFMDLEVLWRILQQMKVDIPFHELLDLYPEFIRYGMFSILEYLYQKKQTDECSKVYIYTNNQCSVEWTNHISNYFEHKINPNKTGIVLFDQIIYAFKINNVTVELMRTTHDKTYNDFIKCTLLPKTTKVCFLDNSYFDEMKGDRIYYIQPLSYCHHLTMVEIFNRFIQSPINRRISIDSDVFYGKIVAGLQSHMVPNYLPIARKIEIDVFVAQKIMYHIKEFFFLTKYTPRTKKIRLYYSKLTRKKHRNYANETSGGSVEPH